MSNEELMMPRYKVIADYPNRPLTMPIGHILTLNKFGASKWWHEYTDAEPLHLEEQTSRNYPAILKQLRWYEERDLKDLPKYVKDAFIPVSSEYHKVYKMDLYEPETNTVIANGCKFSFYSFLDTRRPATEEEYLSTLAQLESANK